MRAKSAVRFFRNATGVTPILGLLVCILFAVGCGSPSYSELEHEEDIEVLIEALEHRDASVRRDAAAILGMRGDSVAVEPLIAALEDDGGGGAASAAIGALGDIGDPRATEPLINIMSTHENAALRHDAASALGQLGDMRAMPALVQAMAIEGSRSDGRGVGDAAASALAKLVEMGPEFAFEPETHTALLESLFALLDSESLSFRADAALLLGLIGDETAIEPLSRAPSGGNREVIDALSQAIRLIMVRISEDDLASLVVYLDHPQQEVKNAAMAALVAAENMEALLVALEHPDNGVRMQAAYALGLSGYPSGLDALVSALDDRDSAVAHAAVWYLGEIGNERAIDSLLVFSTSNRATSDPMLRQSILAALQNAYPGFNQFVFAKLRSRDTALLWYANVIFLGVEDAIPALVTALHRFGDVDMAEDYLNSGQADLEIAAETWAEENGYFISKMPQLSGGGPSWGGD